jgi:FtsP/CotA-like multicopper oxidase with cupredoxin domain
MRAILACVLPLAGLAVLGTAPAAPRPVDTASTIVLNDNLEAAGSLTNGVLELQLEVREGDWPVLGPDRPAVRVLAFTAAGQMPSIPAPLIRVPLGTTVHVTVTNPLDSTLVLHGLASRKVNSMDSLVVLPGATRDVRFTADAEGTYYYWGTTTGARFEDRGFEDSQLTGAFVVDPVEGAPDDRIMIITAWVDSRDAEGDPDVWREFLMINGRPWPYTERLKYTMGDSVRWRLINGSWAPHPMHLHGFYFRIDSRGDLAQDTLYWPAQRRMAVTELMLPGQTMALAWSPDRPGGWIFHCHLNWHVIPNPGLGPEQESREQRIQHVLYGNPHHSAEDHVVEGMGGLMMAMDIRPSADWRPDRRARRHLRLFVQSDTIPADSVRRFTYVLQEGERSPAYDSLRPLASTIVLRKDEPTSIWVHNRTPEATQVHWHGLEIDSYFDGVTGVGGHDGSPTPPIMPGDSFEVRVTPPRAGSFMYHTHINDIFQQRSGLYGALVVLKPEDQWDPEHDRIFLIGSDPTDFPILNGRYEHEPLVLEAGTDYRFRLMNITMDGPGLEVWLVEDGAPIRWMPLAKDGFDLPPWQRTRTRAAQRVSIGETYDFAVRMPREAQLQLELRRGGGRLVARQEVVVRDPAAGGAESGAAK